MLEELKTGDDIRIMQGVIDLSTELSMAQENTMNNFSSDQFIPILVDCLKKEAFPDIMSNPFTYNSQIIVSIRHDVLDTDHGYSPQYLL